MMLMPPKGSAIVRTTIAAPHGSSAVIEVYENGVRLVGCEHVYTSREVRQIAAALVAAADCFDDVALDARMAEARNLPHTTRGRSNDS